MTTNLLHWPHTMRTLAIAAFIGIMASCAVHSAEPAGGAEEPAASPWTLTVAPYFWGAALSGSVAAFGSPATNIDMSFSDILGDLDASVMVAGELRYGRFSLSSDLLYLKLSTDEATPLGILVGDVGLKTTTKEASLLAGYAVVERDNLRIDAMAGPRVWSVDNELSFNGGFFGGRTFEDDATWVDAMGGIKGRYDFTDRFYVTGMALAGAGGSDFGWDLMGGFGYQIADHFAAVAGYRALGVDYRNSNFVFDVTVKGPIVGLSLQF